MWCCHLASGSFTVPHGTAKMKYIGSDGVHEGIAYRFTGVALLEASEPSAGTGIDQS